MVVTDQLRCCKAPRRKPASSFPGFWLSVMAGLLACAPGVSSVCRRPSYFLLQEKVTKEKGGREYPLCGRGPQSARRDYGAHDQEREQKAKAARSAHSMSARGARRAGCCTLGCGATGDFAQSGLLCLLFALALCSRSSEKCALRALLFTRAPLAVSELGTKRPAGGSAWKPIRFRQGRKPCRKARPQLTPRRAQAAEHQLRGALLFG